MTETWKDIKGFEGVYQISNLGRVKSLKRWIARSTNGYWIPERIRKPSATRGGYLFIPLSKDGRQIPKRVSRLVAEAFLEDYSQTAEIHHKDKDRTNNRADNLLCLMSKDHHKLHPAKPVIGKKGGLTIRFNSAAEAGENGFDAANVSRCAKYSEYPDGHPKKRKYATHKGWIWRYERGEVE